MRQKGSTLDMEAKHQMLLERKVKRDVYIFAISFIIMGMIMIIFPEFTLETICYLFAAILAVLGIYNLVLYFTRDILKDVYRYDFVSGVMMLLIAVLLVVRSQFFINLIPMIMGIVVFGNGIIKFQRAIDLLRTRYSGWIFVLIFALMSIAVGIFIIFSPEFIAEAVTIIIGISLVFGGLTDIITLILLGKQVNEIKKHLPIDVDGEYVSEDSVIDGTEGQDVVSSGKDNLPDNIR